MLYKHEALNSNPVSQKKKKRKKEQLYDRAETELQFFPSENTPESGAGRVAQV
jgi:hypothetical protein